MVNRVAFDPNVSRAFVHKNAVTFGATGVGRYVANYVSSHQSAGLAAESVNAAAIGQGLHNVVDEVFPDDVVMAVRGRVVPLPTDGNPGVGQIANLVVPHGRVA